MPGRPIPSIFEEIASLLDIEGENSFRAKAYHNAAKILASIDDLETIIAEGRLKEIRGIGETLSVRIVEYAETGSIAYHEELKGRFPPELIELLRIPNLGPKKIRVLYDKLGVKSVEELERACIENRLAGLFKFGERTQEKILKGIRFFRAHSGEFLFAEALPVALRIKERLERIVPAGLVEVCGSIRRRKEIVRDIDVLAASSDWEEVSRLFVSMPEVEEVIAEGETKTSCRLVSGINADLRVVSEPAFPYALAYFTGSKEHNVRLRGIAKKRGLKLNEYGLFEGDRSIGAPDEGGIYECLGLAFVPPELREDMGEIEAAEAHRLPKLIDMNDIRGAFHVHTDASDGSDGLEAIAEAARAMGLSYVGISDHSKTAAYAGGLKADDVRRQWEAIDRFNAVHDDFRFFKGIESDILQDGSLDYDEDLLEGFDFVVASIHSGFSMSRGDMETRIVRAISNPYTTILGHPTGRLLLERDAYEVDMPRVIEAAAEHGVVIELNASPYRLDIDWRYQKQAKEKGVLISINPDAHAAGGLGEIFYGVAVARKGWLEAADVLNTRNTGEIEQFLERRKARRRI
jgi:DNA polymerase (family 10)